MKSTGKRFLQLMWSGSMLTDGSAASAHGHNVIESAKGYRRPNLNSHLVLYERDVLHCIWCVVGRAGYLGFCNRNTDFWWR
jgi:hypothetical protein